MGWLGSNVQEMCEVCHVLSALNHKVLEQICDKMCQVCHVWVCLGVMTRCLKNVERCVRCLIGVVPWSMRWLDNVCKVWEVANV